MIVQEQNWRLSLELYCQLCRTAPESKELFPLHVNKCSELQLKNLLAAHQCQFCQNAFLSRELLLVHINKCSLEQVQGFEEAEGVEETGDDRETIKFNFPPSSVEEGEMQLDGYERKRRKRRKKFKSKKLLRQTERELNTDDTTLDNGIQMGFPGLERANENDQEQGTVLRRKKADRKKLKGRHDDTVVPYIKFKEEDLAVYVMQNELELADESDRNTRNKETETDAGQPTSGFVDGKRPWCLDDENISEEKRNEHGVNNEGNLNSNIIAAIGKRMKEIENLIIKKAADGVTGKKYILCNICGKSYRDKKSFKEHRNTVHLGKRDYKCNSCEKIFSRASTLRRHKHIHTGKRFVCNSCGKDFSQIAGLKVHCQSLHDGIKFKCNSCEKNFTQTSALKGHYQAVHQGIKFECTLCERSFAQKSFLNWHTKTTHKGNQT